MITAAPGGISAIRRFLSRTPEPERCDFCDCPLAAAHPHMFEPAGRRLSCACPACATLFPSGAGTRYVRVTPRARRLTSIDLGDSTWSALGIPVGLSFVTPSRVHDGVFAIHPSRAGTTETRVPRESWEAMTAAHPDLVAVEPDVEGVLLCAIGRASLSVFLSVDLFHRFVGELRGQSRWSDAAILAALESVEAYRA